jgi:hypothetical protein
MAGPWRFVMSELRIDLRFVEKDGGKVHNITKRFGTEHRNPVSVIDCRNTMEHINELRNSKQLSEKSRDCSGRTRRCLHANEKENVKERGGREVTV